MIEDQEQYEKVDGVGLILSLKSERPSSITLSKCDSYNFSKESEFSVNGLDFLCENDISNCPSFPLPSPLSSGQPVPCFSECDNTPYTSSSDDEFAKSSERVASSGAFTSEEADEFVGGRCDDLFAQEYPPMNINGLQVRVTKIGDRVVLEPTSDEGLRKLLAFSNLNPTQSDQLIISVSQVLGCAFGDRQANLNPVETHNQQQVPPSTTNLKVEGVQDRPPLSNESFRTLPMCSSVGSLLSIKSDRSTLSTPKHIYKTACDTYRVQVGKGSKNKPNGKFSRNARNEEDAIWLCELALLFIDCPPSLEEMIYNGNYKCLYQRGLVTSPEDFLLKLSNQAESMRNRSVLKEDEWKRAALSLSKIMSSLSANQQLPTMSAPNTSGNQIGMPLTSLLDSAGASQTPCSFLVYPAPDNAGGNTSFGGSRRGSTNGSASNLKNGTNGIFAFARRKRRRHHNFVAAAMDDTHATSLTGTSLEEQIPITNLCI